MSTHPPPAPQPAGQALYPIVPRKPRPRWVRWVLAAVTTAATIGGLMMAAVPVSPQTLLDHLRAGTVDEVTLRCVSSDSVTFFTGAADTFAGEVCWSRGPLHYRTDAQTLREELRDADVIDGGAALRPSLVAAAREAGHPAPTVTRMSPGDFAAGQLVVWANTLATIAAVVFLIVGPQPRRMTKWGVFWTLMLPLNVGMLWWLFAEAPWAPRARALPEPASQRVRVMYDGRTRFGGGQMFVVLLLASMALAVVAYFVGEGIGGLLSHG
jgi:hypothetical protein